MSDLTQVSSKGKMLLDRCVVANNLLTRMRGLIGHAPLGEREGMWIKPCNSVHTCFMAFPIDVLFLDEDSVVLHVEHSLRPWRFSKIVFAARSVLEMGAGAVAAKSIVCGDKLEFGAKTNGNVSDLSR